jgi:putative ABC transport system ATP-binding protein
MNEPILTMEQVGRVHGDGHTAVTALAEVTLEIRPGELVAVTGRSGSGKSTLLNLAGGLDRPTTGSVTVDGVDLASHSVTQLAELRRRRIGIVFQHGNLLPTLSAVENIALPLELDGVSPKQAKQAAIDALEAVEGAAFAERFPDELSGGEQQRVAIARGLIGDRGLLLADEPTGALDEVTGERMLTLLRAACDRGAAALLVTHDPAQAAWADRVVRLRDGSVESIVESAATAAGRGDRT